jgi:hypothetical protein
VAEHDDGDAHEPQKVDVTVAICGRGGDVDPSFHL